MMKQSSYARGMAPLVIGVIGAVVLFNIALWLAIRQTLSVGDVIYINGLSCCFLLGGFIVHNRKIAKAYGVFEKLMAEEKALEDAFKTAPLMPGICLAEEIMTYEKKQLEAKENRCREKLTNMTDYTTKVIHDLKVDLSVCEMIAERVPLAEKEKLSKQLEKMKYRVSQVMYVARANDYHEDIKAEYFKAEDIVKKAISENAPFFIAKDIALDLDIKSYELLSDQKWVLYILIQILNNSSKYTRSGGTVKISSKEDEGAYYIEIEDNGIGIAKEELGRVFDKGFTGSNGRLNTKATGMGLYYAKKAADVLHIGIKVASEKNFSTRFTLAFYKQSDYSALQESL